ncbi:MAG: hypothetical protein ACE362_27405 [Phaeodactylibacter xiamenensis]|uniref:DdrB-like domain-containing protein n=1 Tax=Phaeodactylibacter xiamenensis TaxID=1524460 RepID=A0A098S5F3_9BACT|nr:hypothetical protein [Phaeodactylibacter xiamenensis]KGE86432.1 hypothetical protein IX84_21870 [Phaeodactylibacter xiamenensis]MCR9054208.1 hypothetical protein [bacterium]
MTVLGKKIILSMPNGEKRDARFAIVELDSVLASHNELTFAPTPGYPVNEQRQNVNDRNYEDDAAAQERVRDNARRLDPYRLLTTSRTPSGSPIVAGQQIDGKWIVVSGNNRTMSTKLAASRHPENYKAYVDALCEELEAFGFSTTGKTERIDCQNGKLIYLPTGDDFSINNDAYQFRQPLLVRIDYGFPAFQTRELAKYNQSTMKGKRAVDKTIERSNSLRENPLCQTRIPAMLDQHERMSDFYADRTAQKQMLEALLQCNIITEQSVPEYYDEGYFTNAGKELVESVLAGVVLEKAALKAAERDGIKQARRVVVYAMPVLVSNSTLPGSANLIPHINDAILYLNEMKASGLPFDQFINQGALFSEKAWPPQAIYLSRLMSQGQRKFKRAIKAFNESVRRNTGAALFSDENVTPEEAFQAYVIDHIPAEEARLIEAYANAPNPPKSRYPDWLFVGNMGGSTVYADRRKRKNDDYLSIAHLNPYNGEVTRLIKPTDKDYSQDYELVYQLAEEDGVKQMPEAEKELDPRPGDYFVSVHDQGQKPVLALGPFPNHQEALDNVGAVREYVTANDPQGHFYAYGTARQEKGTGNTGKLNSKLVYAPGRPMLAQRGVPVKTDTFFAHGIQVKVTDHGGKDGNCRMPHGGPRLLSLQAKPGSQPFMQDYYKAVCEAARRYDGIYYEVGGPAEELVNKLLKGALESGEPSVKIIFGSRQEVCGKVYHKIRYIGKALPPPVLSPYEQIFMESFGISQADAHEIWMRAMDEYGRPLDDVSRAELVRRGKGQLDALKWERTEEGYQYLIGLNQEILGAPREGAKNRPAKNSSRKKPKAVKPSPKEATTKLLLAKAKKKKKLKLLKLG